MGYYRGVSHKPKRERLAEIERQMREANRGKVQGRKWLRKEATCQPK